MPQFPVLPKHPERICWGCERYCPATDLSCGNGSTRTQHPVELLGEDWWEREQAALASAGSRTSTAPRSRQS